MICHPTQSAVKQKGLTLIEIMVTLAVLAIVLTVAIPSFSSLVIGNRLTAQANELLAGLSLARAEAIKQNRNMIFCHSADGLTCTAAPAAGWQGWLVRSNNDNTPVASGNLNAAQLSVRSSNSVAGSVFNGISHAIRFSPQGVVRNASADTVLNAVLRVCTSASVEPNTRDIQIRSGGRVRVTSLNVASACPQPANPS